MLRSAFIAATLVALAAPAIASVPAPIPSDLWFPDGSDPVVTQDAGGI